MNIRSSDIYLNTLCLAAYAPGNTTNKIAAAVVSMFDDLSKEERSMLSPLNMYLSFHVLIILQQGNILHSIFTDPFHMHPEFFHI